MQLCSHKLHHPNQWPFFLSLLMKKRMYVLFLLLALVYHILLWIYKLDNFLQNLVIPVVAYRKEGQYMEVDLSVQSEAKQNIT
jgi:hypothetical protein